MDNDLSHIARKIKGNEASIAEARRQAENHRTLASQKGQDGDQNGASYYEQEAGRFDQHAIDLENENEQLELEKTRVETRIADLEAQRATIASEHTARLAQIDQDLNRLRGSSLML